MELSREWKDAVICLASEQESIPNSPKAFVGGQLQLCAAASIASAGFRLMMPAARDKEFRAALCDRNAKKELVAQAFEELGLSMQSCYETMVINDQTSPERRLAVLHEIVAAI